MPLGVWPMEPERHAINFGTARLAAWTLGAPGNRVLVMNHGGALDHCSFRAFAIAWAAHYRVILWDMPGHGLSRPIGEPVTADLCARAMATVMDHFAARDAVVVGFSFGGVVAQILAKARPDLVRRLIAYGCLSPHVGDPVVPAALGETNSVSFLFNRLGVIRYPAAAAGADAMLEAAIEAGAEDVASGDEGHEITTSVDDFFAVRDALEAAFGAPEEAKLDWRPTTVVTLDEARALSLLKLVDALEDNDDVQHVYANFDIPDSVMARLSAA